MASKVKVGFIVGTGRCGTTWLGQMLNNHAEICVPPEIQLLFEYSDNGSRLFEEFSRAESVGLEGCRLASIIERCCPHKLELFFDYHAFCNKEDTPKGSLVDFVTAFYSAIAMAHGKSWLIEQTPWYGSRLDLLSRFFPDAKVIHVVRDGRDVATSFSRTPWWHISPRLNLARWQREIKKIKLDAAFYLDACSFLEVKYEDLVVNTEFEMRRICEFLGIDFSFEMLNLQNFIDYGKFYKFDMHQISSQAYIDWCQHKESVAFSDNVEAWKKNEDLFHSPLPDEIVYWLKYYYYDIKSDNSNDINIFEYYQEYTDSALESINLSLIEKIHATEDLLQQRGEHIDLVTKDWVARGDQITQLAQTVEAMTNALRQQAEHAELVTKDWAARGDQITQLAQTIEAMTKALRQQAEHAELVTKDWTARGDQIAQLAHSVGTMSEELRQRSEHAESVAKDWLARGERIDQLTRTVEILEKELSVFRNSMCGVIWHTVSKIRKK